jgi:hypothetical protein
MRHLHVIDSSAAFFRKLISKPLYPFLFIAHYFLHVLAVNIHEPPAFQDLGLLFAATAAVAAVFFLLFRLIVRGGAAFFTGCSVWLFFSFGHAQVVTADVIPHNLLHGFYALAALLSFAAAMGFRKSLPRSNPYLNIAALFLLLMPLWTILRYQFHKPAVPVYQTPAVTAFRPPRMNQPDIYYFILDEYPRADVLKERFGFDNSEFLNFLKERGFYIAENSHTNYLRTRLSLPSALNMQYLDFLTEKLKDSRDTGLVTAMVRGNNLARVLKSLGYRYVVVDSGQSPSDESPLADLRITYSPIAARELHVLMANSTLAKSMANRFLNEQFRKRHLYNFEQLRGSSKWPRPKFVFAHMVIPHMPFVFDRRGEMPAQDIEYSQDADAKLMPGSEKPFLEQMIYLNGMMRDLIDRLLEGAPQKPVIVIQADHGPWVAGGWSAEEEFLSQRAPILNAYLVPDKIQAKLYPGISPVNSFRLILNGLFGARYPLLPDKTYYSHPEKYPYRFTDVTDRLK